MAGTFRRRGERHKYSWVLGGRDGPLHPRSEAGRRALARFHSDKSVTMGDSAPRWVRKMFDRKLRTYNYRVLRRWVDDQRFDPVFQAWHMHAGNWCWW